jgi:hypothetical protein
MMVKINESKDLNKLGSVSKVIALLVLDRQKKLFSKIFEKKYTLRLFPHTKDIEVNEAILTKLPNFIENLVIYLDKHCRKLSSCHNIVARLMNIGRSSSSPLIDDTDANSPSMFGSSFDTGYDMFASSSGSLDLRNRLNASYVNPARQIKTDFTMKTWTSRDDVNALFHPKTYFWEISESGEESKTNILDIVFNSPRFDRIKMKNVHSSVEEEKNQETDGSQTTGGRPPLFVNGEINLSNMTMTNENLLLTLTNIEFLKKLSKSSIVEVLFILSKLMFCSKKVQVQKRLHNKRIISVINKLYWLLLKTMDSVSAGQDMKIQILKLVINYLSRDADNTWNKLECISTEEIITMIKQEIAPCLLTHFGELDESQREFTKALAKLPSTITLLNSKDYDEENLATFKYSSIPDEDKQGFMTKIIQSLLKTYSSDFSEVNLSNLRYWKASWIESFVRGCNPFLQLYICRSGIIKTLVKDIIEIEQHDDSNLQTAFDILGEVIKFNKRTFLIVEAHIKPSEKDKFKEKCLTHLVDSNVFLRSILLTMFKFTKENMKKRREDRLFDCDFMYNSSHSEKDKDYLDPQLCRFVNDNISRILNGILSVINPSNISQTNLSCLNTVIIIFIIAKHLDRLPSIYEMLERGQVRKY